VKRICHVGSAAPVDVESARHDLTPILLFIQAPGTIIEQRHHRGLRAEEG